MLFLLLTLYFGATFVSCDKTLEYQNRCSPCPPGVICASEIKESCQNYLICSWDPNIRKHIAHEVHCAFGTFYNRDENSTVLCDHPENVKCTDDPCKNQPDGTKYKDNFGCRGYWECKNGISNDHCCLPFHSLDMTVGRCVPDKTCGVLDDHDCARFPNCDGPAAHKFNCRTYFNCTSSGGFKTKCCPPGQAYDDVLKDCVTNAECIDKCEETPEECYLKAVPGHPTQFKSADNSIQNCSYGTVFSEENCTCVNDGTVVRRCLPVVYEDFSDKWNRQYYENAVVFDPVTNKPVFGNGTTYIQVPYFDEASPANKLMIKTVIKPAKTAGPEKMLLVSSCQSKSPVQIVLDPLNRKIYIEASTDMETIKTTVDYMPGALNEFMFKFDKPVLTVLNTFVDEQYNVRESEGKATLKEEPGHLQTWTTSMFLGGCPNNRYPFVGFKGQMDLLYIYHECFAEDKVV